METYQPPVVKQFVNLKRHEPVIMDSSAMMTYKTCPRLYLLRIILGFVPKETPPYFGFGTAYHKFREVLERSYKNNPEAEKREHFKPALIAGITSYENSGAEPALGSKWQFLTIDRLMQSFKVAYDHWLKEKHEKRIIVLSSEESMIVQMPDGTFVAGRKDQGVRWNGDQWGRDFKTSSKMGNFYERTLEPNDQFTRYTYMESVLAGAEANLSNTKCLVQGQIVEVLYNTDKQGPSIFSYTTRRTLAQLKAWMQDHKFWMDMIKASRDNDNYPMNEKSCPYCPMHSVCKMDSESAQLYQLKSNFRIEPWDCTAHSETSAE